MSNSSDTTGEGVHWATVALSIERDDEGAIEMHDEGDEMGDECAYESGTWDDEYAYEHEMWDDECAYENEMWDDHLMPGSWDTGGGDSEEANAPSPACAFATQADNLERIGAAASLAPYLSKRAAELRRCSQRSGGSTAVAVPVVERLWREFGEQKELEVRAAGLMGVGVFAVKHRPLSSRADCRDMPIAGVLVATDFASADGNSRMQLPRTEPYPLRVGSFVGAAALVNAGCRGCSQVEFSDIYHIDGVRCVKYKQRRVIQAGQQVCCAYGLAFDGGACPLCDTPLKGNAYDGQGGHNLDAPPAGWRRFHVVSGRSYDVNITTGETRWAPAPV